MVLRTLLPLVILSLAGCGGGTKTPPATKGAPANLFSEPTGPMPPLPGKSSFTPDLDNIEVVAVDAPADAVLLRWDFSTARVLAFDYRQTIKNTSEMGGQSGIAQNMEASGTLLMKSEGNKTGRMILQDLKMQMKVATPGQSSIDPMSMDAPVMVVPGIREDGSLEGGQSAQEIMVKLLFPLPAGPLKLGESAELPAQVPFNMMGSVLNATGTLKTTLTRFVKVEGRLCAQLDTVIDIGKFDVPAEVKAKAQFEVKGTSVALFNIEEHRFVAASQAVMMAVRSEMALPKFDLPGDGQKPAVSLPKTMRMVTDSDNLINIRWNAEKTQAETARQKASSPEKQPKE